MERKIRVLMAKPGLDGHDLGAKYITRALMDAGMEVIYTGLQQTPDQVVAVALQEDVDVIGCSFLSGAHLGLMTKIMNKVRERGIDEKIVIAGGAIPSHDIPLLKEVGVAEVFPTAAPVEKIVEFIKNNVR
jgi:methylmalonyl-CoA mutase C-terminal domain/subunit